MIQKLIRMIKKKSKILITGHNGLVGSSLLRYFKSKNYLNLFTISKNKLDLRDQKKVYNFFLKNRFDAVINAAAKVGGILANNKYRADFINDNLIIQNNIINACFKSGVKNLIFLGSSCIYPKKSLQPIKEEYLLRGSLELTNEPYAIAKIAGIKLCESFNFQYKTNFKCLMPCNLYGPNDNYDLDNSHFFPAIIKKILIAKKKNKKSLEIWGTGKPKRELMYVDDLSRACEFFLKKKTKETLINIGVGKDLTITDYTKFLMKKLKVKLKLVYDKSKPDGTYQKLLDCKKAKKYGWRPIYSLNYGTDQTLKNLKL